jgi:hypothetical protein
MPVETPSLFAQAIQEHLDLKQRNSQLERRMPLGAYKSEDPFENHPLFKTEEQARLEDTMDGIEPAVVAHVHVMAPAWPGEETVEHAAPSATHAELEDSLWGRESRDFDWGD